MTDCRCFSCTKERCAIDPGETVFGQPVAMIRMFLCEVCGNKRCPHAADHRNACTSSNEPGQAGSLYEHAPTAPLTNVTGEQPGHAAQVVGEDSRDDNNV